MSTPFSTISQNLRANLAALRDLRGLTQAELGLRAGVGAASISHFETGQRIPSLDSLIKVADALDVSVDALLGRIPLEASLPVDPIFIRASKASAETLDTLRRVTAALLSDEKGK